MIIAGATPLNYLILIDQAESPPQLLDCILIPPAVFEELQHEENAGCRPALDRGFRIGLRRPVRPPFVHRRIDEMPCGA